MLFRSRRALLNVEVTTRVPGICFAEWGPGDMSMSYGYRNFPGDPLPDELQEARERVRKACLDAGIAFLEGVAADTVTRKIDEGVKVGSAGAAGPEVARVGREYTGRTMPV